MTQVFDDFPSIGLQLGKDIRGNVKSSGTITYIFFDSANAPHINLEGGVEGSGRVTHLCRRKFGDFQRDQVLIEYVPDSNPKGRAWYVFEKHQ